MRHLTLTENSPARPYDLTQDEAHALSAIDLAVVTRVPGSIDWLVAAGSKVGVARVGALQVTVTPKIPLDRLMFLLGYSMKPTFWREHSVLLDSESDLAEALAHTFRRLASKALEQGILQGYRAVDDSLPVLRGRIRVGDQIARRFGVGLPLEVSYDDFTVDIPENQILLAAALVLLRMPSLPRQSRQGLQRLRLQLVDVTPASRSDIPTWVPSRLNRRYQAALRIAELVLAGDSFEQRVGELQVSGFVFDMWRIYEDFVTVALREALAPMRGTTSLQHTMHLDLAEEVVMRPDFYWIGPCGQQIVMDAKYKAEKPAGFPQADLYQMLAYCTVLRLSAGHLIYARGNEDVAAHQISGSGVTVSCHTLDLEAAPSDLLTQVAALAAKMVRVQPASLSSAD